MLLIYQLYSDVRKAYKDTLTGVRVLTIFAERV